MALSLQQIRDYVRNHMDLEVEDLPDAVLDVFIREGSRKVESAEQRWPFYEASYSAATAAAVGALAKSAVSPELKRVSEIVHADNGDILTWVSVPESQRFNGQSGRPTHYAEWGDDILLLPTPDAVYSLTIFGYRHQRDWVAEGAGAEPDMDEPLHNTVALWALHRAYAQQEDPEQAGLFHSLFDTELNELGRRLTEMPLSRPLIMNRQRRRLRSRPLFDWEVG